MAFGEFGKNSLFFSLLFGKMRSKLLCGRTASGWIGGAVLAE
jgi:hypothetical protein